MSLGFASVPLAYLAGALSILSPCVWPLVPIVMSSAATAGRSGPLWLALGLSVAFALAGTVLTYVLLNLGLGLEIVRYLAGVLLLVAAIPLLFRRAGAWLTERLSVVGNRFQPASSAGTGPFGQFGIGALVGLVWLPCVGPTLGAAIALASLGQDMAMAFVVMFAFGIGIATVLLLAGYGSAELLRRWRPGLLETGGRGKRLLGAMLLLLGILVLSGWDKQLESWALTWLPDWAVAI